jgi:hypothetical protein
MRKQGHNGIRHIDSFSQERRFCLNGRFERMGKARKMPFPVLVPYMVIDV